MPDDATGPMPMVSADAAQGFPAVGGEPGAWSDDEDAMPTGGFPVAKPADEQHEYGTGATQAESGETESAYDFGRAPFEPADTSRRSYGSSPALDDEPVNPAGTPDSDPYSTGTSSFGYGAFDDKPEDSSSSSSSFGYGTDATYDSGTDVASSLGYGAPDDGAYGSVADPAAPPSASSSSSSPSSFDYGFGETPYDYGKPEAGYVVPDESPYGTNGSASGYHGADDEPGDAPFGYGSFGDESYGSERSASPYGVSGEAPYDVAGSAPSHTEPDMDGMHGAYPESRETRAQRVTAEEQAAENDFFAQDDHPPLWDKKVAPAGPPPQPGKPSSGNLRLPDWMRDEAGNQGSGGSGGSGDFEDFEDEASSKRSLYIGVAILVAGLIAVAGVYVLKDGGESSEATAAHSTTAQPSKEPSQSAVAPPPAANAPREKTLTRFKGVHTKAIGRVADQRSGLSYPRLARPWELPAKKSPMTEIGFSASQFAVTEQAGGEPTHWARLMSGVLTGMEKDAYKGPGTERDAATQVADLYEERMFGFEHKRRLLGSQPLDIDGHKGWLVGYYLTYHRKGVKATGDILTVALIDTGKQVPGVLLMSTPNTDKKIWPDVNFVNRSIKVL